MEPAQPSPAVVARPPVALDDRQRAFLEQPLFAALATVDLDGAPRQAVIWYRLEADGAILLNSRAGRRWPANLARDGRVGLAFIDPADGNRWIGLTGRVAAIDRDLEQARDDIVALAHRYEPEGPTPASLATFRSQTRISFRIAIEGVHDHLED
jgi:PPOX class probable F420-dependent enzyme